MLTKYKKIILAVFFCLFCLFIYLYNIATYRQAMQNEKKFLTSHVIDPNPELLTNRQPIKIISWQFSPTYPHTKQDLTQEESILPKEISEKEIRQSLRFWAETLMANQASIYLFQNLDIYADRSWYYNSYNFLMENIQKSSIFRFNHIEEKIPFFLKNPFSKAGSQNLMSGNAVFSSYPLENTIVDYSPKMLEFFEKLHQQSLNQANITRPDLLEARSKIKNSDKDLVVYNINIPENMWDVNDEQKISEFFAFLNECWQEDIARGNYLIVGGNFGLSHQELQKFIPPNFALSFPEASQSSENKSENSEYVYYLSSNNVKVEQILTLETGFAYNNFQPLKLTVSLK